MPQASQAWNRLDTLTLAGAGADSVSSWTCRLFLNLAVGVKMTDRRTWGLVSEICAQCKRQTPHLYSPLTATPA